MLSVHWALMLSVHWASMLSVHCASMLSVLWHVICTLGIDVIRTLGVDDFIQVCETRYDTEIYSLRLNFIPAVQLNYFIFKQDENKMYN